MFRVVFMFSFMFVTPSVMRHIERGIAIVREGGRGVDGGREVKGDGGRQREREGDGEMEVEGGDGGRGREREREREREMR